MAMTEQARHELYEALKERIGVAPANTLMDAIPPAGWADVAMKRDLDVLQDAIRHELRASELSLRADLTDKINDLQRNLFFGLVASQAAFAALIVNLVR